MWQQDESGVVSVTQVLPAVEKAEIEPTPRGYGQPPAGYGSAGNTTAPAAPGGKHQGYQSLVPET